MERCAPSPRGAAPHLGGGKRNPDWSACLRVYLATPSTLWRSGCERGHPFLLRLLRVSVFKVLANVVHSYCKLFTNGSISRPSRCGCGLCRLFFFFPRVLSPPVSRRPSAVLIRSPRTGPEWRVWETSLPQLPPSPREPFPWKRQGKVMFLNNSSELKKCALNTYLLTRNFASSPFAVASYWHPL